MLETLRDKEFNGYLDPSVKVYISCKFKNLKDAHLNFGASFIDCEFDNCKITIRHCDRANSLKFENNKVKNSQLAFYVYNCNSAGVSIANNIFENSSLVMPEGIKDKERFKNTNTYKNVNFLSASIDLIDFNKCENIGFDWYLVGQDIGKFIDKGLLVEEEIRAENLYCISTYYNYRGELIEIPVVEENKKSLIALRPTYNNNFNNNNYLIFRKKEFYVTHYGIFDNVNTNKKVSYKDFKLLLTTKGEKYHTYRRPAELINFEKHIFSGIHRVLYSSTPEGAYFNNMSIFEGSVFI